MQKERKETSLVRVCCCKWKKKKLKSNMLFQEIIKAVWVVTIES